MALPGMDDADVVACTRGHFSSRNRPTRYELEIVFFIPAPSILPNAMVVVPFHLCVPRINPRDKHAQTHRTEVPKQKMHNSTHGSDDADTIIVP